MISHPNLKLVLAQASMKDRISGFKDPSDSEPSCGPFQFGMLTRDTIIPGNRPWMRGPAQNKKRRFTIDWQWSSPSVMGGRALGNQIRHK
jgi:hypothetical protein